MAASIEKNLLSQLPNSPPDIEALRLYLTLPECPLFSDPNNFTTLAIPFALAIVSLKETPLKVLGKFTHLLPNLLYNPNPNAVITLIAVFGPDRRLYKKD